MERKNQIRKAFFEGTAMAFVLLFCYAATSKLADFQNFQVQLAQSPILSGFSTELSYAVPSSEFLIVLLLLIPEYRLPALYLSFTLMVLFTAYIFIILNYSSYIPCSCGGVLEKLGWQQHLIFNVLFISASVAAILLQAYIPKKINP